MDALNTIAANSNTLSVEEKAEGYPVVQIRNASAEAQIALHGAHVLSFKPKTEKDALWLSDLAIYEEGKAIRGGIPVCWPWFGNHPTDDSLPPHGFVRQQFWELEDCSEPSAQETSLVFRCSDNQQSRSLWPHSFDLRLTITVSNQLKVSLQAENTDSVAWTCGGALHSYFAVGHVDDTSIEAVKGHGYLNKPENFALRKQQDSLIFDQEVDRVYCDFSKDVVIDDKANGRRIRVGKTGSRTTVIWNPWIDVASTMKDMRDEAYKEFVCVEPANAFDDVVSLKPGETHELATTISIER